MKKLVICFIVLVFSFLTGCSDDPVTPPPPPPQNIEYQILHGGIFDSVGNKPLDSAQITTQPPTKTVYSNTTGYFEIDSMVVGTKYTIIVEKNGYSNFEDTITIKNTYNQFNAMLVVENSLWTYLTTMNEYMNSSMEVLPNGNLLSTTRILNSALNTYVQVAGSNQWNFILDDEETDGYYKNPYNNYMFAYTGDNISPQRDPDLYLSMDNGLNWTHKSAGSVLGMAFFPTGVAYVAMYYPPNTFELKKSTNHGLNWLNVDPIPGFQYYNIKKVLNERIYLQESSSGNDTLFFSDNEGQTWQPKILTNPNYATYIRSSLKLNSTTLICMDFYNPNFRIMKSADNGDNWSPINSTFPSISRDSVSIFVASNSYIYAINKSEQRGIYVSTDNGIHFSKIGTGLPISRIPQWVGFDGQGYVYVVVGDFYINNQYIKKIYKSNVPFIH
jgi:hypothetical protein